MLNDNISSWRCGCVYVCFCVCVCVCVSAVGHVDVTSCLWKKIVLWEPSSPRASQRQQDLTRYCVCVCVYVCVRVCPQSSDFIEMRTDKKSESEITKASKHLPTWLKSQYWDIFGIQTAYHLCQCDIIRSVHPGSIISIWLEDQIQIISWPWPLIICNFFPGFVA